MQIRMRIVEMAPLAAILLMLPKMGLYWLQLRQVVYKFGDCQKRSYYTPFHFYLLVLFNLVQMGRCLLLEFVATLTLSQKTFMRE